MKKSVILPEQYYKGVQMLPPEQQGEAYNAYFEYAFYGKKYEGDNITVKALLASVEDIVTQANENYQKKVDRMNKVNDERNRNDIVRNRNDNERNRDDIVSDTVTVTDISPNGDKEKPNAYALGKKKPRPTLDEVKAYADEKGRPEEAEHFFDFYTANGWKVGKNPMKDWQAAFRNWLKNDFDRGKPKLSEADFYASIAEAERTRFGK